MEAARMKRTVTLAAMLLFAGGAQAGDVYVTRDAKGNPVYTDTPQTVPAEKLGIRSASTDPAEVQKRYAQDMQQYAEGDQAYTKAAAQQADDRKAKTLTAEDRAKRCTDARQRYQAYMDAQRLYESGPNDQRRYLTSDEIDAARANAKQVMNEFCGDK
jgi:hypothetical protein